MRTYPVIAMVLLVALGCAQTAPEPADAKPAVDLEAERQSLLASDQAWYEAYSTSDDPADVFALNVVDDASFMPPGAPISKGRLNIKEAIAALEAMDGFSVAWSPTEAMVSTEADLGYTIGTYEMTMPSEGGLMAVEGEYLTVWRKQEDGSWMVAADMFNANGPPQPAEM